MFVIFSALSWFYLTQNLYFHLLLYLLLLAWILFAFEKSWQNQSHRGVVDLFKLQENVVCKNEFNTSETLFIIENLGTFIFMPFSDMWLLNIFGFSNFSYTHGLNSIVFSPSKYIKIWYFSHKIQESSVGKKGASSGFNSRVKAVVLLTFMTCIGKLIDN